MKKFLFGILFGIFSISPIFLIDNITYAQDDACDACNEAIWRAAYADCIATCSNAPEPQDKKPNEVEAEEVWIDLACLTWMCTSAFSFKKLLFGDSQQEGITVKSIAQDAIFAATYLVWTILTIVIIYCWLMYIFSARSGKADSKYKTWLINAWIWALLVRWAYAIVRLIQYIARW